MPWFAFRRFVHASVLAGLLSALTACSERSLKWTEEVKLPDGRIVVLTRHQEFRGPHELGQPPTESDYWLEFRHPDTGERVRWNGRRDLGTIALLMREGAPELLMSPWLGGLRQWRCPDPPYLLFRYEAGQWKQIPLMTLRGQKIRPNMTLSPSTARRNIESHGHHLSWQLAGHVSDALKPIAYIGFTNLTTQTFDKCCQPPFNTLEVIEGGR